MDRVNPQITWRGNLISTPRPCSSRYCPSRHPVHTHSANKVYRQCYHNSCWPRSPPWLEAKALLSQVLNFQEVDGHCPGPGRRRCSYGKPDSAQYNVICSIW